MTFLFNITMTTGKHSRGGVLTSKESDWNIVGYNGQRVTSRTRFGGQGRPNLVKKVVNKEEYDTDSDADDSDWESEDEETSSEEEDEDSEEEEPTTKPEATRVIVEVASLQDALQKHCVCPECKGALDMSIKTLCLATMLRMTCPCCGYIYYSNPPPSKAEIGERIDDQERSTDYAINVLYALAFLTCGDGCKEAARVLGLLGLPNDTTMESRTFTIIEDRISPVLQKLGDDVLLESLMEEVKLEMEASNSFNVCDFDNWKRSLNGNNEVVIPKDRYPKVTVSFDMAWQQRNSGHRYNSPSGHGLLVGGRTRKPIAFNLKSKFCNYCKAWEKRPNNVGIPVPIHLCMKNHECSSASMEALSCLNMVEDLYTKSIML
jgi:rubredoxin